MLVKDTRNEIPAMKGDQNDSDEGPQESIGFLLSLPIEQCRDSETEAEMAIL